MKKSLLQKVLCVLLSATTLFGMVGFTIGAATSDGKYGTNRDTASSLEEMQALVGVPTYEEYLDEYGDSYQSGITGVSIDMNDIVAGSTGVKPSLSDYCLNSWKENQKNWLGFTSSDWNSSVYLPSEGSTTWNFQIPDGQSSYYYIKITYYSCITEQSSISQIERKIFIDGKAPFKESSTITLNKGWKYDNVSVAEYATSAPDGTTTEYDLREDGYYRILTVIKDGVKTVTTYKLSQDINGNSMQPMINQSPEWNNYYVQDSTGYYEGYLRFYLTSGSHQFTLAAQREPVIVKSIELIPYDPATNAIPKYEDVLKDYADKGYGPATGNMTIIEAEFPDYVSDSSVYPTNDGTSCVTYPSSAQSQLFNVIGENSYNTVGQWAAYKFSVDSTGLYKISMRYLQKALEGMYVCRAIKLSGGQYGLADGTPSAPFEEAYDIQFDYNKNWQSGFISDSKGTVFEFYFEANVEYTLYLECSLGSLKDIVQRVEKSVTTLNDCYLQIIQLTGSSADPYRTYEFMEIMPHVVRELLVQAIELMKIKNELEALCGTSGTHTATLETVARLLDKMGSNNGDSIAANLSNFKSYLGTLGTWVNDSKTGKLIVDSICVTPSDTAKKQLPAASANFFKSTWFEITSFIYSFFTDYNSMGLTTKPDEDSVAIDVWLASGRDQANIWRSMLDAQNGFTDSTGYAVRLKLIAGGLLPSILAGKGPDVYMGLGEDQVINYSIRGAIMGVSGNFEHENINNEIFNTTYYTYKTENGYEVTTEYRGDDYTFKSVPFKQFTDENFVPSAMDTITLLEISYGVPQTMDFSMMFYRMDVLADLGLEVPETWSQMLAMLPVFQANNMEIGVSYMNALNFMLYQKGGNMWKYTELPEYAGAQIALDTNVAIESFEFVCRMFTEYSFPVSFNAANRFRTGETPMLVGSYEDFYNKLIVYATEIEGLWEFCPIPGTETGEYDENGKEIINYSSHATIGSTVMLNGCTGEQQFAAWEYMQWQTSAEVQSNYGNRMVALIGPSAKYAAANINAIKNLSWTQKERAAIEDQIAHMCTIVNYPGSYIINRYIGFAFLDAVNNDADPVDAISEYIDAINSEVSRKRQELGLKTLEKGEVPPGYDRK